MHTSHFLRSQCSHPQASCSADSGVAALTPGRHPSSHPSTSLGTTKLARDDLADQPVAAPVVVESLNPRLASDPLGSIALPTHFSSSKHHALSAVPRQLQSPATTSQEPLFARRLIPPPFHRPQDGIPSTTSHVQNVYDSRNVSVDGNMNTVIYMNTAVGGPSNFMKELLEKTISGAAFDSSARDPPARCHPGTRLTILERCLYFIINCCDKTKMRWVFGAAGVGKSAIMQSVAESPLPSVAFRASVFFFVNGRSDGTKALVTLAYQLAAKCNPYRQFIEQEITRDPSLLQSSMSVQFNKFVVEPFIHHPQLNSAGRVLIIIDGLDECDQLRTQQELLRHISDLCLTYPTSPVVWMIASRPEPHITSFFAQSSVKLAYEKEEVPIDSNEARADVEKFLRFELAKIQNEFSPSLLGQWPPERDIWKLSNASGGLFVYAYTVIKYISNPYIGNPTLQLNDVLQVIDTHSLPDIPREEHPMALLDALYSQILSKVPIKVRQHTRKLLLSLAMGWKDGFDSEGRNFIVLCNWLGMTYDEAYAAIRHLSSVLDVPGRDMAHMDELRYFHKSFLDYIFDYSRSEFSEDITHEAHQLYVQCALRVLGQAPDGIDVGDLSYSVYGERFIGTLVRGPGSGGNISLTWPAGERSRWSDNKTRLYMYKMAVAIVEEGIRHKQHIFYTWFCIRLLATRFQSFSEVGIPNLHQVVFDKSRRDELIERGLLQRIPVRMLDFRRMRWHTRLHFHRPTTPTLNLPDPWNRSCEHRREGKGGKGKDQTWSTDFKLHRDTFGGGCNVCCRRLERQLEKCKAQFADCSVLVLFTSAGVGLVEIQFVDSGDGMAEWTYWLWHRFSEEKRKKLGSAV